MGIPKNKKAEKDDKVKQIELHRRQNRLFSSSVYFSRSSKDMVWLI